MEPPRRRRPLLDPNRDQTARGILQAHLRSARAALAALEAALMALDRGRPSDALDALLTASERLALMQPEIEQVINEVEALVARRPGPSSSPHPPAPPVQPRHLA